MESRPVSALLISTYELGRQPFGLTSPAAWLERAGASVTCLDLSRDALREELVRSANLIAFYVPMHTATRLAIQVLPEIRKLNPSARLCFYGLYAPVNEAYLRKLGAETVLGGEFETGLVAMFERLSSGYLRAIEDALARIRHEKFGICDECAQPISKARLEAVPWTRWCRDCKERQDSQI